MLPAELHDWVPALLGGLSAFADALLGVGAILPGEVVISGLALTADDAQTVPLIVLATAGASLGDHLNYGLGRVAGIRLAGSRVVAAIGVRHWERGACFLDRHGPRAIVLTRLVPVVRTLVPAIAGATELSYRRFLPASLIGSLLWSSAWVLAADALSVVAAEAGVLTVVLVVVVAAAVRLRLVRTSRRRGL